MRKEHTLTLYFEDDLKVEECTKSIQSANALEDSIRIHENRIDFLFFRSKWLKPEDALKNKSRLIQIQRALLYVTSLSGNISSLSKISYEIGAGKIDLDIPESFNRWVSPTSAFLFEDTIARQCLLQSETGKSLRAFLTNFYISEKYRDNPYIRFRFLWSSFNALYSYDSTSNECDNLRRISQLLQENMNVEDIEYIINDRNVDACNMPKMYSYISLGMSSKKDKDNHRTLRGAFQNAIQHSDERILKYISAIIENKNSDFTNLDNEIQQRYNAAPDHSDLCEIIFLCCGYLYGLRNSIFHGKSEGNLYAIENSSDLDQQCETLARTCVILTKKLFE